MTAPELAGGPWAPLAGLSLTGYEIHHGCTEPHPAMVAAGARAPVAIRDAAGAALGWCNASGRILGLYLHGLFEDTGVLQALFGADMRTPDQVFDGLADFVDRHFEPGVLAGLLTGSSH